MKSIQPLTGIIALAAIAPSNNARAPMQMAFYDGSVFRSRLGKGQTTGAVGRNIAAK